jgi:hypothetical protein
VFLMRVRKEVGQSGISDYWWENDGDVVEVPWDLGAELISLKGAGFTEVRDEETDQSVTTQSDFDPGLAGDVPVGTAADVLDWVGADKDRAVAALDAEKGRGSDGRTSLIAKLEKML